MKYQCEHSDTGLCEKCFKQPEPKYCVCGTQMNTEHDDRKFELDGKEVCVECFTRDMNLDHHNYGNPKP